MNRTYKYSILGIILLFCISFSISCASGKRLNRMDRSGFSSQNKKSDQNGEESFTVEGDQFETEHVNKKSNNTYDPSYPDPHKNIDNNSANRGRTQGYVQADSRNPNIYGAPVAVKEPSKDSSYRRSTFFQTGMASWYGREFHGKTTASGESFDMNMHTAAHKTLPFGSIIEIKNFDNNKVTRVRVNDRGPYYGKRILDISFAAARELDLVKAGESMVGIRIVKEGSGRTAAKRMPKAGATPVMDRRLGEYSEPVGERSMGMISIQVGAFYSERNADKLKRRLESLTDNPVVVVRDNDMFKVRIRGIQTRREAMKYKRILMDEDLPAYIINRE